jgi:beta-hydroxylase
LPSTERKASIEERIDVSCTALCHAIAHLTRTSQKQIVPANSTKQIRRKLSKKLGRFALDQLAKLYAAQSLIGTSPVLSTTVFPWLEQFEANWAGVKEELDRVLEKQVRLPSFHEVSPDQKRISIGDNWKVFPFYVFGQPHQPNCLQCPKTAELLRAVPNLENAMFSILAPHYKIPPHRGPTNGIVRIHLGLVIPDAKSQCQIRVHDQVFGWEEGECVVFDDHYEHEVWNNTDQSRIVLFFDVDRPMRLLGRFINRFMIAIMRRSAYVQDARQNLQRMN